MNISIRNGQLQTIETGDSIINRMYVELIPIHYTRRYGERYTANRFEQLSRIEQDLLIAEVGKEINRRRH